MFHSCIKFGVQERSQRALDFSANPIPRAKIKNPFPADIVHVEGR